MRSGSTYIGRGYSWFAGVYGDYWSYSGGGSTTAYYLYFDAIELNLSVNPSFRYGGFSLRCLQE